MRWLLCICVICLFSVEAQAARVAFVCAGWPTEEYWRSATSEMEHAAKDLGWELNVYYANREPLRQITLVEELIEQNRPDYLLVSGERGALVEQLRLADEAQLPTLVVFNSVQPLEREVLSYPRSNFEYWLGSLAPSADEGGYMSAKALIAKAKAKGLQDANGKLQMVALYGDRSTHSSVARNQGMLRALSEHPEVVFHQGVSSDWSREKAELQATHLLRRYPNLDMIWSGSDQLMFGAMQAASKAGRDLDQLAFSGINTSVEALEAVKNNDVVLAGGHYIAGAWGLLMLYDYHNGVDFADTEGLEMERSMFTLFDPNKATALLKHDSSKMDFRRFSKARQPEIEHYSFGFDDFLRGRP